MGPAAEASSDASFARTSGPSWRWLLAAAGTAGAVFLVISMQVGTCIDYAAPGPEGTCTVEPAVGIPAAWILGTVGVLFIGYSLARAFRRRR
ncbi:MAG: hypothetical protein ABWY30_10330 [Microterricola sp.]